ncbi:MAG: diguanylate cyclase, partial [Lachnospiraceae bacterium]|nr:diguanylate cyclase [Lachnospiraceae bacterium]
FDTRFFRSEFPAGESHYFVYLDANGLHEMNDENGHAAGDEMLCGVASVMQNQFGANDFRIGGDEVELSALGTPDELTECLTDFKQKCTEWKGKFSETLSVSKGYAFCIDNPSMDIFELIREADKQMYSDKSEYYRTSGHDRRRRSDD